jgi:hypothetical protein
MLLDLTITQLDIGPISEGRAQELAALGYLQWLGALPGDLGYPQAAMAAYEQALPFRHRSPAIAVFCDLLVASTMAPVTPVALSVPWRQRRGGAQARRAAH